MTRENGRFLPVLCRVLSQNHMTHHESVPGREGKRGKREVGGEKGNRGGGVGKRRGRGWGVKKGEKTK